MTTRSQSAKAGGKLPEGINDVALGVASNETGITKSDAPSAQETELLTAAHIAVSTPNNNILPTSESTTLSTNTAISTNDLTALVMRSLASISSTVERINQENKQNRIDMQELRAQISSLNRAPEVVQPNVTNKENIHNGAPRNHVFFEENQQLHAHSSCLSQMSANEAYVTPPPTNVVQPSLCEIADPQPTSTSWPTYSMPYVSSAAAQHTTRSIFCKQNTYEEDIITKLYPLPVFDGKPEDWPLFSISFNDTTTEFGYSNRQNLMRLQKALAGEARQVVVSLLIFPENVPQIMEELRFNFGRPEILVRSQLLQLQQVPAIAENSVDGILHLSNKVRNIVALFKASGCKEQLMNSTLLEQLLAKLPRSKQFEWANN